MSPITLRKLAAEALLASHSNRPDRVLFEDTKPTIERMGASLVNGSFVRKDEATIGVTRIVDNNLRLICLSGIGDAIWTRGVVAETIKAGLNVYVDTVHPWVFWDFVDKPGFNFWTGQPIRYSKRIATYLGSDLRSGQTVYGAMASTCHVLKGDFSFSAKSEWVEAASSLLSLVDKPILLYRPLVHNKSRKSVTSRNPDVGVYEWLYKRIKDKFFTVAVASAGKDEFLYNDKVEADLVFCKGELPITTVIGLMSKSAVVLTNPGMALVIAASMGIPVIGVFGGYEDSHNYIDTVVYGKSLLIDPIIPCRCMSDSHACKKEIDLNNASKLVDSFILGILGDDS